ncbi:MAG: D-alanine--D-alanine ligase [Proteobacteria bacterium]|nr:D-alanine--D-alanine ligase [Pseudomonadota bacterium]MDA0929045.1 D-alanine--D-alanine ligase [Pseudomonadota bacterium]
MSRAPVSCYVGMRNVDKIGKTYWISGIRVVPGPSELDNTYVPEGMPPLDLGGRSTSYFEFWPMWLMYVPVVLQWLLLSLRYRSLSLPLIASPAVPLSGMVGVAKSAVFDVAGPEARDWILPWMVYEVSAENPDLQAMMVEAGLGLMKLELPVVGKPNIGCRGSGVKLLKTRAELAAYISEFPQGGSIQFQQLSRWEPEAGVFYVRHPDTERGEITSLTLKYTPYVVGDGNSTLRQLIARDPRAGELKHLYQQRHAGNMEQVIPEGEPYRLVFSASHCRGAVFRDGNQYIDSRLVKALDRIFDDIPGYYYGRLDIKFRDLQNLQAGYDFEIIEINGASSESIHIWDRNARLSDAFSALLQQYSTLFKLGAANRRRGHKTPGLMALIRAWRYESNLVKQYPHND